MTKNFSIFQDKTPMPADNEMDRVATALTQPEAFGFAKVPGLRSDKAMSVANVERPRRGHDY